MNAAISTTKVFPDVEKCVDTLIAKVGKRIVLGMPLGLGKPTHFVNALYARACQDKSLSLTIITALSLERPIGKSTLEKNFLEPFVARQFEGVPDLNYAVDLRKGALPSNVEVEEFYFKAGAYLGTPYAQQRYISSNYTHVTRDLIAKGVNVVAQSVGVKEVGGKKRYSLSCNADLSLDLVPLLREKSAAGEAIAIVGEVNRELPFMENDADVDASNFDLIVDHTRYDHPLFAAPHVPIAPVDHLIGFYASTLVRDAGTLQLGIGSLGSAVIYSSLLRHQKNDQYRSLIEKTRLYEKFPVAREIGGEAPFEQGLYGCSEMMVDGFLHLYKAGILKRKVYADTRLQNLLNAGSLSEDVTPETLPALMKQGVVRAQLTAGDVAKLKRWGIFRDSVEFRGGSLVSGRSTMEADLSKPEVLAWINEQALGSRLRGGVVMHGGFFLGPKEMYDLLREFSPEDHQLFCMTSVNYINHLYDHFLGNQALKVSQRQHARFINNCMVVTLNGAAASDSLANGRVVSGVGGQYNFVSMAHELAGARSVLSFKATRFSAGKTVSNIVFNYGYCTIPRHLRDIYITEYGIADVRGKCDRDVMIELIKIADSRFQDDLLNQAKAAGKIPQDYQLPELYRNNTPKAIQALLQSYQAQGDFEPFPFGCDFTPEELKVGKALKQLKAATSSRSGLLKAMLAGLRYGSPQPEHQALLERMNMTQPEDMKARIEQRLLVAALNGKVL